MAASQTFSNYPNGFAGTLLLRGVPLVQTHPGKVYWVSNNTTNLENGLLTGSNGNTGGYRDPFATIAYALTIVKAGRGDIILVKPGHAENVSAAAGLTLSVNGVAIIGLGNGSNRPTITLDTANTSTIAVAANDVVISNFLFLGNFLNIATVFNIANAQVATGFTVDSCEFRDVSAILGFVSIIKVGTTANIADGLTFTGNKIFRNQTGAAAASTAVVTASALDRGVLSGNYIVNSTANNNIALLLAGGALALTNLTVDGNRTVSPNTGTTAGELISSTSTACSGLVSNNYSWHLASTGLIAPTGTKLAFVQNFCSITGAADKSALLNPVAV